MYYMITYLSSALGTADAEINVPSFETRVDKCSPLTPGVGQNIAMHASPAARNFFLALISTFPVHSPSYFSLLNPFHRF